MKYLKDNLKKCLDRRGKLQNSGAAASQLPRCAYFEEMRFLHDKTSNLPTESNVPSTLPLHQPAVVPHSPINPPKKRKAEQEVLMQEIKNIDSAIASNRDELDCEDFLFCKSLVPSLKRLDRKSNARVKIKIRQLLYETEFGDDV